MRASQTPEEINIGNKSYSIVKPLGKGMFGEVLLAKDLSTNELVAIKKFGLDKERFEKPFREGLEEHVFKPIRTQIKALEEKDPGSEEIKKLQSKIDNYDASTYLQKFYQANYQNAMKPILESAQYEQRILNQVGDGIGPLITKTNDPLSENYYLAMKLAAGQSLTKVLGVAEGSANPLSTQQLFDISLQLIDKLIFLQKEKGIVLRDLHTNNLMYEEKSNKLTVIDYGDALELKAGNANGQAMGSDPFMAPEVIAAAALGRSNPNVDYNEKTTVATAGAVLARLFDLADIVKTRVVKNVENGKREFFRTVALHDPQNSNSKIPDQETRKNMLNLLGGMLVSNPAMRETTLEDAREKLVTLAHQHKNSLESKAENDMRLSQFEGLTSPQKTNSAFPAKLPDPTVNASTSNTPDANPNADKTHDDVRKSFNIRG